MVSSSMRGEQRESRGNGRWPKTLSSNGSQQVHDVQTPEKLADLPREQDGGHPKRRPQKLVHTPTGAGATNQSALIYSAAAVLSVL
ncbi:hypothetical protein LEMLEM_LOCUS12233 [Lemmus lemmus]